MTPAAGRVELPVPPGDSPGETACLKALRDEYGVGPMDPEAMLAVAFPVNYVPNGQSPG